MVRVGVEAWIEETLLKDFSKEVQLVRLAEEPKSEVEIDFLISGLSREQMRNHWKYLKGVQVIQSLWAGVDSLLDLIPPGVILCDARGVHDIPTAEWAVAAILAMQKYFPFYIDLQTREDWAGRRKAEEIYLLSHESTQAGRSPVLIDEVADMTVLIVGYGAIGEAIEARLGAFGARFLRIARNPRKGVASVAELDELLGQADIVVLTVPLTTETKHLMDAKRLRKMKPGALLVNAARGAIVDTEALCQILHEKKIRAAIDVTDPEPLPAGHMLWKAPNLLITPHVAGNSPKFTKRVMNLASEQAQRFARGEPLLNIVTGEY